MIVPGRIKFHYIEEKNPLKQGLKHSITNGKPHSTKIEEKNPLKQGLKPRCHQSGNRCPHIIEEKNPLKQGLKQLGHRFLCSTQ